LTVPNGHFHYEACDQLIWKFTDQGYPEFLINRFHYSQCVRLLHLSGVRGYAPQPRWETFQPPNDYLGKTPRREDVIALATRYVEVLSALLNSNPNDPLTPSARTASMAWLSLHTGWAIRFGNYSLYVRAGDEPLREIPKPEYPLPPGFEFPNEAAREEWEQIKGVLSTDLGVDGLRGIRAEDCVYDIRDVSELLCSTTPLHESPSWPRISALPVFDPLSAGLVVEAMRDHGLNRSSDQLTLRWRRPEGE
jgi:hypothetical protein